MNKLSTYKYTTMLSFLLPLLYTWSYHVASAAAVLMDLSYKQVLQVIIKFICLLLE